MSGAAQSQILVQTLDNTGALDAFGRARMSSPFNVFSFKQLIDAGPLFFDDQQTSGAGTSSTYTNATASSRLAVSLNTAGVRVRQSFRRWNYQPGKAHNVSLTGNLNGGVANVTKRIGLFDGSNGVFFQLLGNTLSVVQRSSVSGAPVDTVVAQANWNLDKCDGSGHSSVTIDTSKVQIFCIDFQWLGTGSVRFGFQFGRRIVYCHEFQNANALTTVYMSNPNLPIRYEIGNSGAGGAASLDHICSAVASEGGFENTGFIIGTDRAAAGIATTNSTNIFPVVAIRLRSTAQFASIRAIRLSTICVNNTFYRWCLLLNPTVVGTALSFVGVTNSAIEADVTATNATTLTGGTILGSGYVDASSAGTRGTSEIDYPSDIQIGASIAGVSDVLVLAVQEVSSTVGTTFFGALSWREEV